MHRLRLLAVLVVLAGLTGCVRSVHPIYTEQDIVFEPALVGRWGPDGSKEERLSTPIRMETKGSSARIS
jgi:hypothetical protein